MTIMINLPLVEISNFDKTVVGLEFLQHELAKQAKYKISLNTIMIKTSSSLSPKQLIKNEEVYYG